MSIYFDFKTINELTEVNYYRQEKEFTLEELSQYNGSDGNPAYVAIEGIVYDIGNTMTWSGGTHFGLTAGQDLTSQFNSCHGIVDILNSAPKVGVLIDDDNMNYMSDTNNMNFQYNMPKKRQVNQDKSKFTPDDWIRYITPLVTYALREPSKIMNTQNLYQKVILMGVLVGLGKTPQEAINQVRDWQDMGVSQILKSGTSTGGIGTTGSMGTSISGTTGAGTAGSTSAGGGIGTTGGIGTGGSTGTGFDGTGGSTSIGNSTGTRSSTNTSNRLYFD